MKLIDPTDDQLNEAFAVNVAGWTDVRYEEGEHVDLDCRSVYPWKGVRGTLPDGDRRMIPRFTESADAVLPWLEKWNEYWEATYYDGTWHFAKERPKGDGMIYGWVKDRSFPRAAVIALLRAHGVEVEFTPAPRNG